MISTLQFLTLSYQRIRVYGIAMVDLAVYEVGLRGKVTFWGKELKETLHFLSFLLSNGMIEDCQH
ncbi:hypothetical protein Tco_0884996, partial [Tanacetum coccineum]